MKLAYLETHYACDEARAWFKEKFGRVANTQTVLLTALKDGHADWVRWYVSMCTNELSKKAVMTFFGNFAKKHLKLITEPEHRKQTAAILKKVMSGVDMGSDDREVLRVINNQINYDVEKGATVITFVREMTYLNDPGYGRNPDHGFYESNVADVLCRAQDAEFIGELTDQNVKRFLTKVVKTFFKAPLVKAPAKKPVAKARRKAMIAAA